MAKKRDENKDIRNFSLALAVLLGAFGGIAFYRERETWLYLAIAAAVVLIMGLFIKPAMRPVFRGWMWLAMKLNWVVTRIILTTFWLIVFVPAGLILRLFRVDFFDRRWNAAAPSYWHPRPDGPYDRRKAERLG